jgi:hypothetical protein
MPNKKVAILLSGHLRSVCKTIENMKEKNPEFLDPAVTDFFIHTWKGENKSCWKLYPSDGWKYTNRENPAQVCTLFPMSYLTERVNVVSSREEDDSISEPVVLFGHNKFVISAASMMYARREVYRMFDEYCKSNNMTYDFVIRTRPDIGYESTIPIDVLIERIKTGQGELYVPRGNEWGGMTDQMCMGSKRAIQIVCGLYDTLKQNKDAVLSVYANRLPDSVENMLLQHITMYGLGYHVLPIGHNVYRHIQLSDKVIKQIRDTNQSRYESERDEKWKPIDGHPFGFSQADIDYPLKVEEIDGVPYISTWSNG